MSRSSRQGQHPPERSTSESPFQGVLRAPELNLRPTEPLARGPRWRGWPMASSCSPSWWDARRLDAPGAPPVQL